MDSWPSPVGIVTVTSPDRDVPWLNTPNREATRHLTSIPSFNVVGVETLIFDLTVKQMSNLRRSRNVVCEGYEDERSRN